MRLECGDPAYGFTRIRCSPCGTDMIGDRMSGVVMKAMRTFTSEQTTYGNFGVFWV